MRSRRRTIAPEELLLPFLPGGALEDESELQLRAYLQRSSDAREELAFAKLVRDEIRALDSNVGFTAAESRQLLKRVFSAERSDATGKLRAAQGARRRRASDRPRALLACAFAAALLCALVEAGVLWRVLSAQGQERSDEEVLVLRPDIARSDTDNGLVTSGPALSLRPGQVSMGDTSIEIKRSELQLDSAGPASIVYRPTGGATSAVLTVEFSDSASAAQVRALLQERRLQIVDGPSARGLYGVSFLEGNVTPEQISKEAAQLRERTEVITHASVL